MASSTRFVLVVLFIVWFNLTKAQDNGVIPFQDRIELIFELQDHFKIGCIVLYSSLKSMSEIRDDLQFAFELHKSIPETKQYVPIIVVSNPNEDSNNVVDCQNPLRILPRSSQEKVYLLQISKERGKIGSTWLQFLSPSTDLDHFFDGVDVPFDCEFLVAQRDKEAVTLTEVFRVREDLPLQRFQFGTWRPNQGLQVTEPVFHERRNNMQGIVLKTAIIHDPPTVVVKGTKENLKLSGFIGKTYRELERLLNFTTNFTIITDGRWGNFVNGSWDGVIGTIVRREVDMFANDFIVSGNMKDVLDHTIAIYVRHYHVFIKMPSKTASKWTQFFDPFTKAMWKTIVGTIVGFALYMSFVHGIWLRHEQDRDNDVNHFTPGQSMFWIISIFMQQGYSTCPDCASSRVVYFTALLTSLTVMAAYNAILVSFLSVHNVELPFTDIRGLLADPKYEVGVFGVPVENRIGNKTLKNGDDLSQLAAKIRYYKKLGVSPMSVQEGLNRVCKSKYAFLIPEDSATYNRYNLLCPIVPLPDVKFKATLALAMTKDNPYRTLFNHVLHKLLSAGVISRLHEDARGPTLDPSQTFDMEVYLEDVMPALVLLSVTIVLAVVLLSLEHAHFKRTSPLINEQCPDRALIGWESNRTLELPSSHGCRVRCRTV